MPPWRSKRTRRPELGWGQLSGTPSEALCSYRPNMLFQRGGIAGEIGRNWDNFVTLETIRPKCRDWCRHLQGRMQLACGEAQLGHCAAARRGASESQNRKVCQRAGISAFFGQSGRGGCDGGSVCARRAGKRGRPPLARTPTGSCDARKEWIASPRSQPTAQPRHFSGEMPGFAGANGLARAALTPAERKGRPTRRFRRRPQTGCRMARWTCRADQSGIIFSGQTPGCHAQVGAWPDDQGCGACWLHVGLTHPQRALASPFTGQPVSRGSRKRQWPPIRPCWPALTPGRTQANHRNRCLFS